MMAGTCYVDDAVITVAGVHDDEFRNPAPWKSGFYVIRMGHNGFQEHNTVL